MKHKLPIRDYALIVLGSLIYAAALCFYVYPRSFTFGGTSGLSVLLAKLLPLPASAFTVILNTVLMVLALVLLGRQFAIRTLVGSVLTTYSIAWIDLLPFAQRMHTPWMWADLVLAVFWIALGTSLLFSVNASSGGTDIIAVMITSKKPGVPAGRALFISDILIVAGAFLLFGAETGICSVVGLILKALFVDALTALGRRLRSKKKEH
ncbi:MAG: YitT family protein [Ruminococcaceae bacterium]|nr:YitT family protein [Oscillospiraceae bacterium]